MGDIIAELENGVEDLGHAAAAMLRGKVAGLRPLHLVVRETEFCGLRLAGDFGRRTRENGRNSVRRTRQTHLRTSNPIESVFSTVRHRTVRTKGALSQDTARIMVFKLIMSASKTWRRLQGQNQLPKIISGVKFNNGIEVASETKSAA